MCTHYILQVCKALYSELKGEFIRCPITPDEWLQKAKEFGTDWQYPRAVSAIDGKHIEIEVSIHRHFHVTFHVT